MHMISPDRTRFCCHILTYLVTIHLLYQSRWYLRPIGQALTVIYAPLVCS